MKKTTLSLLFLLLIGCFPFLAEASIGVTTDVQGSATLTRDHQFLLLEEGVEINTRDIIHTGADSSVQLDMDDGSILSLGANSHISLSQYSIDHKKRGIAATINLVSGWLRFAVAKLRTFDSHFRFTTSTAVLGVRGTEGLINVEGRGIRAISSMQLMSGEIIMGKRMRGNAFEGQTLTIHPGEFASREAGGKIVKQTHAPTSFTKRIPPHLKSALKHQSTQLRGIKPKPLLGLQPPASTLKQSASKGLTQSVKNKQTSTEGLLYKVFNKGDKPKVKAELTYTGSGILRGIWEIAEPSSTSGNPIFHPLSNEQKFLGQLGQVTIYSPELPSNMTGLYMLRFRITNPLPAFTSPVIRYFVTARRGTSKPAQLQLIRPIQRATITQTSQFSWQKVSEARAYLLEFFMPAAANPDQPVGNSVEKGVESLLVPAKGIDNTGSVSGMLIATPSTALSHMAYAHLKAGQQYLWRVRAIDATGRTIGESPLRIVKAQ